MCALCKYLHLKASKTKKNKLIIIKEEVENKKGGLGFKCCQYCE